MGFSIDTFAANLRAERARKGMSQVELAEASGINRAAIGFYENGEQMPGADKIFALADALGVTPNELIGWKE